MLPTWDQIQRTAYERWERRGSVHGLDQEDWAAAEMDLAFQLNYRPAAEYPLTAAERILVGSRSQVGCRFCERSAPRAVFSEDRQVVPSALGGTALYTADLCDDCHEQFATSIDADFSRFWGDLSSEAGVPPSQISIGAYKALVRTALAIMPARELQHFSDTLEWVGNPDHDFDSSLFAGAGCLVYRTHRAYGVPWVSLSRRTDPDAPLPYAVLAMGAGRTVLEIAPPLCARDQDHDESTLQLPPRSFTTGYGPDSRAATHRLIGLESSERPRRRGMRLFA